MAFSSQDGNIKGLDPGVLVKIMRKVVNDKTDQNILMSHFITPQTIGGKREQVGQI